MLTYMFLRLKVTDALSITNAMNASSALGYRVVSHDENDGEYSFVLERVMVDTGKKPTVRQRPKTRRRK